MILLYILEFFFFFLTSVFLLVEMTTKFNKGMYAKMRSKKDEPLSNIRKKGVRVTGKSLFVTPIASATPIVFGVETARTAFPATSVEEIPTPSSKRPHLSIKEKEKADSCSPTIWDDEGLVVERAHGVVTAEVLKVFSGMPFNTVANQHIHKLVQVKCSSSFSLFLFLSHCTDGFNSLFKCWGRVSILLLSTSLRRPRWRL